PPPPLPPLPAGDTPPLPGAPRSAGLPASGGWLRMVSAPLHATTAVTPNAMSETVRIDPLASLYVLWDQIWVSAIKPTPPPKEHVEMTERVREILSWYGSDNPGTLTNLARLLQAGKLAGTGRLVILPVDQGFEHGPARSFAVNPPAYDPLYHFRLAVETG